MHMLLQRKKGKFIGTGHFFPHCMAFLEKWGGPVPVYVFLFPVMSKRCEHAPKMVRYPPWYLVLHKHISAIPHFATYHAMIVQDPIETSTKEFCDTIARSIASGPQSIDSGPQSIVAMLMPWPVNVACICFGFEMHFSEKILKVAFRPFCCLPFLS